MRCHADEKGTSVHRSFSAVERVQPSPARRGTIHYAFRAGRLARRRILASRARVGDGARAPSRRAARGPCRVPAAARAQERAVQD